MTDMAIKQLPLAISWLMVLFLSNLLVTYDSSETFYTLPSFWANRKKRNLQSDRGDALLSISHHSWCLLPLFKTPHPFTTPSSTTFFFFLCLHSSSFVRRHICGSLIPLYSCNTSLILYVSVLFLASFFFSEPLCLSLSVGPFHGPGSCTKAIREFQKYCNECSEYLETLRNSPNVRKLCLLWTLTICNPLAYMEEFNAVLFYPQLLLSRRFLKCRRVQNNAACTINAPSGVQTPFGCKI